jgi:hypothetical protein
VEKTPHALKKRERELCDLHVCLVKKKKLFSIANTTMFDTVCSFPLKADLFTQAIHPNEPIVSVGLSSGDVQTFRLPSNSTDSDDDAESLRSSSVHGTGHIDTIWSTRRHKGSCRCLTFGIGGETLYSAGTDGILKAAKVETGVVENKIAIPLYRTKLVLLLFSLLVF